MEKIIGRQEEKDKVMVVDWYKDEQPRKKVFTLIQLSLNTDLPESYDRVAFVDKNQSLDEPFCRYGNSRIWLGSLHTSA